MEIYVVIKDMSTGNDFVGEMWQETKIFNGDATLQEVMDWANEDYNERQYNYSRKRITITKPHPSIDKDKQF